MARFVRLTTIWLLLAAPLTAAFFGGPAVRQTPAALQAAAKPATAVISGQLVDAGTGSPVSSAIVSLAPPGSTRPVGRIGQPGGVQAADANQLLRVMTDGNGRFVFHSLPAGAYSLSVERIGYVPALFSQAPAGAGGRIELGEGQRLLNVRMTIWKEASISGMLRDEAGEPAVAVNLRLISRTGPATARRYGARFFTTTDDRGMYRFGSLPPGDYLVEFHMMVVSVPLETTVAYLDAMAAGASSVNQVRTDVTASGGSLTTFGTRIGDQLIQRSTNPAQGGLPGPIIAGAGDKTFVYPTLFFPGVPLIASATVVTLGSGEARTGVDFALRPVPAVRVTGVVTGPGGPVANMTVKILPAGLEGTIGTPSFGGEVAHAISRGDGTFTVPAVPAGEYMASVVKIPGVDDAVLSGRASVRIVDANVDGVAVHLAPGATVSGRVEFETGIATAPTGALLQRGRITVSPVEGSLAMRITAVPLEADGSFRTRGHSPGQYTVGVSLPAPGWALKSLMAGGRDLLDEPLDLGTSDIADVIAIFTDKASEVSGVVKGAAAGLNTFVLLVPVDARAQVNVRRMRIASIGTESPFQFTGVLPGEYFLVAAAAANDQFRTDVQATTALARRGMRVTIGDREKRSFPLDLLRARQP